MFPGCSCCHPCHFLRFQCRHCLRIDIVCIVVIAQSRIHGFHDAIGSDLNCEMDESLPHDYGSDFIHEHSGVTMHEIPLLNNLSYLDKRSNSNQVLRDSHKNYARHTFGSEQGSLTRTFWLWLEERLRSLDPNLAQVNFSNHHHINVKDHLHLLGPKR
ncbi:hypothetical protein HN51_027971 [Arachis hypogaea]